MVCLGGSLDWSLEDHWKVVERLGEGYDIIANENLSVPPMPTPPRNSRPY